MTKAERPAPSWTVFRLPRSHWHCQLDSLEWDGLRPKKTREAVDTFVTQALAGEAPHLVLTGAPGSGKTHIGVGVYRALAGVVGTGLATWVNVPAFCEAVKRSYRPDEPDPWVDIEEARRLVVLDDLFGRELTSHEKDQIVTRLLDTAYQNHAAVCITMNPSVEELRVRLPAHEISRVLAHAVIIPVQATHDWRRGQ